MLKASGVRTVVASDFSPGRRALAERCGADVVVDPGAGLAVRGGRRPRATSTTCPAALELAVGTREKLGRLPVGWWHVWRAGRDARRGARSTR